MDASSVLAALLGEPGDEPVRHLLPGGCLSAVNADEFLTRLARGRGSLAESKRTKSQAAFGSLVEPGRSAVDERIADLRAEAAR